MKENLTLLVALLLILVLVHSSDPDLEVKKEEDGSLDSKKNPVPDPENSLNEKPGKLDSDLESKKAQPLDKDKDQAGSEKGVENNNVDMTKGDPSKPLGDKKADNVQTGSSNGMTDGEKKKKEDKGSGSEDVPKKEHLPSTRKESSRGEQCDSSFKCTVGSDENHGMVACLRVPGDESPELSLLIQNKGKDPLDVQIIAPDIVRLEKRKIHVQGNDNQKVMVSIGNGNTNKFITLKTDDGDCSLDFKDFLTHNPMKKSDDMPQLTYSNLFRRTPFLGLLALATLLVIASVVMCVSYQRRRYGSSGIKYQKLDAELPVSGRPKLDFDQKDGWDDNWSDDWGDVEAPSTPSMPVTPSISSSGVSSRRVNKEGWKD